MKKKCNNIERLKIIKKKAQYIPAINKAETATLKLPKETEIKATAS